MYLLALALCILGLLDTSKGALTGVDASVLCNMTKVLTGLPASWKCDDQDVVAEKACDTPWEGLTCTNPSNSSASITAMSLTGLSGTLPADLGLLDTLRTLKLSGTGLVGPLPNLNDMKYLVSLDISGTSISGGCFPQSLINNEVFSNCATPSASFSCACDAPAMCRAKTSVPILVDWPILV